MRFRRVELAATVIARFGRNDLWESLIPIFLHDTVPAYEKRPALNRLATAVYYVDPSPRPRWSSMV